MNLKTEKTKQRNNGINKNILIGIKSSHPYINNQNKDNNDQVKHRNTRPTKQSTQKIAPTTYNRHTQTHLHTTKTQTCPHAKKHAYTQTPHTIHKPHNMHAHLQCSPNTNTQCIQHQL